MNRLYLGDNLEVIKQFVDGESVNLIYADPPFGIGPYQSKAFRQRSERSQPSIEAFTDTWAWSESARSALDAAPRSQAGKALAALEQLLGPSDLLAYLAMMAPRLEEFRRVLRPTGSLFLHVDPTTAQYSRILLDAVFGAENYRSSIVWRYGAISNAHRQGLSREYDVILYYSRSPKHKPQTTAGPSRQRIGRSGQSPTETGVRRGDVWDIPLLSPVSRERLGYPTQKPLALITEILQLASREGDLILDPFVGGGTTIEAAERLTRRWLAIDLSYTATAIARRRLIDAFGPEIEETYEVVGAPDTSEGALELARQNPARFEGWVLSVLGAALASHGTGRDRGVDGEIHFYDELSGRTKHIAIIVKARRATSHDISVLMTAIDRERADIGVLVTAEPSVLVREKAAAAGRYRSPTGDSFPRLQVLGIEDLIAGRRIRYPGDIGSNLRWHRG